MAEKKGPQKTKDGKKVYGPYKPKSKGGRPVYSVVNADGSRSSTHAARFDYEKKNGKLPKGTDVDHKDNNKKNGSSSNLRAMPHGKNVAKENKHRVGKKENQK